ncbi:ATP-binding protein [Desulfosudis oleivorans]|uniref:histidine kinase n=1 Tax=Desulfosudis oleivorans (strain DSM 6200 / JCM 39069 / Hxd3) TaxID=96561 RepID=A9A0Q6_DESOH|nr:ATP-binding protein [Desulfosudis oleivorans]ABW69073.1 histidine kinase [Desulfosudis oleivorans Hxd3]
MRFIPSFIIHRSSFIILFSVLSLFVLPVFASPPVHAEARLVRVGVYENAPKVFVDGSTGEPAGIFIDVLEHVAKSEGWTVEYVSGTWGEGLDRLERGDIDLMPDVAHTSDREKIFAFHKTPVLSSWFQVYARKGSGIRSIVDLSGKRVAVLERSVQQAAFVRLADGFGLNATIMSLPDYATLFDLVARGEADAAVTNRFYGLMHAKRFGLEDTAIVFNPSNLFFAAPKGKHADLLSAIDTHLEVLKADSGSVYYQSLKKWTSEKVAFVLPDWVKLTGLVAGTVLIMSLGGSLLLKRRVDARTRELRQINNEMDDRIRSRTAELADAMKKARAADHLKSAFLATMSHELRTPLNSIIGFTGMLLQELPGPLNEEQKKQMGMVQTSARHLLALINDVLDISKIEAGQLSLAPVTFDLRSSIEKTAALVAPLAEKNEIDLKVEIGKDVGDMTTDQRRLEQVVLNLLNNAVKFTETGSVSINCRTDTGQYVISVADTGIGIQPEDVAELFQPFHQVDTGLSRRHEGTGLGLSISKRLVAMMGGAIEVQSEPGKGSTFTVRLPKTMMNAE